jgi:hypothetical protein
MPKTASTSAIFALLLVGCDPGPKPAQVRRFSSVLTPTIEVQADMSIYLNQQRPLPGGAVYRLNDPLPEEERIIASDAFGIVRFEIEGDEFTMTAAFTGLPDPTTVTDPRASYETGGRIVGDYWDIWLLSDEPNVVTIQMGELVADPDTPGAYSFHFDSRTGVDFFGRKMSVNNIFSMQTEWPNEPLSLYDVRVIGMDIEAAGGPEEPSGQHRMNDISPFARQIDWTRPDP